MFGRVAGALWTMPFAFAVLVGFQLLGEVLRRTLHLPLPAPLVGMFLLTLVLAARGKTKADADSAQPSALHQVAHGLIANMGLLFVPAGAGVVTELGVLRHAWIAVLAGLVVSTALSLAVTGLLMHRMSRGSVPAQRETQPAPAR
jgi:holin-like protein